MKKFISPIILIRLLFVFIIIILTCFSYIRNSVWQDQVSLYEDATRKSPKKARPHAVLGLAYKGKGLYPSAFRAFEKATQCNSTYVEAFLELGLVSELMGQPRDGLYYFALTLNLDPSNALAHEHIGYIYYLRGNFEKAIYHLEAAIKIKPSDQNYYNLGLALEKKGDLKNAIVQYIKAIEINTAHPDAYLNLANAYLKMGMKSKALTAYENALKINPDDDRVQNNLRILLEESGGHINAVRKYDISP